MQDFMRQFYDKHIWWAFCGLLLTHLVAVFVQGTAWAWLPLITIGIGTSVLAYKKLEWGLAIAFLEIFVGGHGHLIDVQVAGFALSVREVIFAAVMGTWLLLLASKKVSVRFVPHRDLPLALIALAVMIATAKGFLTNIPGAAFDDMNGYLTLLYFFPVISLPWNTSQRRLLLQMLAVAAIWVAATTLFYLYAFTHLPGKASHVLYTFVRDARLSEVTLLTTGPVVSLLGGEPWYFRIFQQSQAVVAIFELLLIAATFLLWREKVAKLPWIVWLLHALMMATLIASMSRSFWIGCIAGYAVILGAALLVRVHIFTLFKRHIQLLGSVALALFVLWLLVIVPLPARPDLSDSSFYRSPEESGREVAVSSRWNLLRPMVDKIWQNPIIGSGFGETVTFISDDPRIRAQNPTGEVTTYRFEWGYHDLWLKMGLLGLLAFGWYFMTATSVGLEALVRRDERYWIVVGLTAGIVMIFAANTFSPYLNHPIGLGFMIFILPFFPWEQDQATEDDVVEEKMSKPISVTKPSIGIAFKDS